ncbi:MAG: efflux RND transporter periplasmic adaptor subunit [Fibrobacterota bacterium]
MKTIISAVFCAALIFSGCSAPEADKPDPEKEEARKEIPIEAFIAEEREIYDEVRTSGTVEGIEEASISSEASGRVVKLNVKLGDFIKKGNSIMELAGGAAKAAYEQARIQYEIAQRAFKSTEELYKDGNASEIEYKNAKSQLKLSEASLERAMISYKGSVVAAPVSGYIVSTYVRVGELLSPGQPVAKISNISSLKVRCYLGEEAVSSLSRKDAVKITIPVFKDTELRGRIAAVGAGIDEQNGGYPVDIHFNNIMNNAVKSGMTARVALKMNRKKSSVTAPSQCFLESGNTFFLYSVMDDNVQKKEVERGRLIDGNYEILGGINAGDTLAGTKLEELYDGAPVKVHIDKQAKL